MVQKLVNILKQMDSRDPYRIEMTDSLLEKLWVLINYFLLREIYCSLGLSLLAFTVW